MGSTFRSFGANKLTVLLETKKRTNSQYHCRLIGTPPANKLTISSGWPRTPPDEHINNIICGEAPKMFALILAAEKPQRTSGKPQIRLERTKPNKLTISFGRTKRNKLTISSQHKRIQGEQLNNVISTHPSNPPDEQISNIISMIMLICSGSYVLVLAS